MKLTWHGHSFFELETATGTKLLIDPFTADSGNPATRTNASDLVADAVLVTHGHGDHWGATERLGLPVVAIHELAMYAQSRGLKDATPGGAGMNMGGTAEIKGTKITMVPAVHSSGFPGDAGPFAGNGGTPAGYILDDGETKFYHMGDTFLFGDLKTVIRDLFRPKLVAMPIGGLFTMDPHQARTAAQWLGCDAIIPIHYNTFPPIRQDAHALAENLKDQDVHVMKPDAILTY